MTTAAISHDTAHVCNCPACRFVARRAEETLLAKLTFDLSYDAVRRMDFVRFGVSQ